jgi:hypothetical protein
MASFKAKQVPQSMFVVYLFWGISASILYADQEYDLYYALMCVAAILFGFIAASFESESTRRVIKQSLLPQELGEIRSSLGPVPVHVGLPDLTHEIDFNQLAFHYPLGYESETHTALATYRKNFSISHPHYVSLFDDLLRLFTASQNIDYPASYAIDASGEEEVVNTSDSHAGRSLLSHSLLVFTLSVLNFASFCEAYAPEKPKRAQHPTYKPDPIDPLPGLLGLAHDVGKFLTFTLHKADDGKLLAKRLFPRHDAYGPQVLARLPSFWDSGIRREDRQIIENVLACYHHPKDAPFVPATATAGEKDRSDRETALLQFLIASDKLAGAIEGGQTYQQAVAAADVSSPESVAADQDNWVDLFLRFLATNHCINVTSGKSLAFKTEEEGKSLLVVDETLFINHFCEYIKQPELSLLKAGKDPHPVTSNLLMKLEELDVVYRPDTKSTHGRSAELNIFKVMLLDKDDKPFAEISRAFTLDLTSWGGAARLKDLPNTPVKIIFGKCRFGARGARKDFVSDAINEAVTGERTTSEPLSIFQLPSRPASPKKVTKKSTISARNPEALQSGLALAIRSNKIPVEKEITVDNLSFFVLVGQDDWFIQNGYPIEVIQEPLFMLQAGIREIKPSKTVPDKHVITIQKIP